MAEVYIDGVEYVPKSTVRKGRSSLQFLLSEARIRRCETLEQVAAAVGTSKAHLWTLEAGHSVPRLGLLQRLLEYLDIDFYEISMLKEGGDG